MVAEPSLREVQHDLEKLGAKLKDERRARRAIEQTLREIDTERIRCPGCGAERAGRAAMQDHEALHLQADRIGVTEDMFPRNARRSSIEGHLHGGRNHRISLLSDTDNDTSIQVEKTSDEDVIHFNAAGVVDVMTIADHGVDIHVTATETGEHALEMEVDAAGFGDVKAISISYDTGALATGEAEAVVLININEIDAAGGDIFGSLVLSTEGAANDVYGLGVGVVVGPIHQDSGTFVNPTTGTNNTASTDVADMIDGSTGTNTTIFVADNDFIIIGAAAAFTEIEFVIETGANQPGIKPTFAYSTAGSGQFTNFSPIDATNGFRNTGVVSWEPDELTGHVANDDTGTFDIKITRTHQVAGSVSLFYAKTAATVVYTWDKDGDLITRFNYQREQSAAGGDTAALGQVWVINETPNRLLFTDDAGTDFNLSGAASATQVGPVELATAAETTTGTDGTRAVTPDGFAGSDQAIRYYPVQIGDKDTNLATGDNQAMFHIPVALNGMDLVSVHAEAVVAGTTGTMDIQIRRERDTADMLSTKLTLDNGETGSDTAATPPIIDGTKDDVVTNDRIEIDIDVVHTTPAKGVVVTLGFRLP